MSAFGGHSTLGTGILYAWGLDEASGNRTDLVSGKVLTDNNTVVTTTAKRGAYGASFSNANKENLSTTVSLVKENFSVSLWFQVKDNTNASYRILFSCGYSGTWANKCLTGIYCNAPGANGQTVYAICGNAAGSYNDIYIDGIAAANNTWYHLATTYNAATDAFYFYANGANKTTDTWVGTPGAYNDNTSLKLGIDCSNGDATTQYLDGALDEVYCWQKVLTDQEVSDLYASGSGLFYRSSETFTKTGQTDGVAGVQSSLQFDRTGTVAGSSGLSGAVAIGLAKTGLIECTSEVAARQMDFYDNSWRRPTGNRRETHETLYNRRILYPSAPRNWRNKR